MKKLTLILIVFFVSGFVFGQNEVDALRFSQTNWQGTARFMGAGSAFGAVGGDFSAVSTNPASIGIFKKHTLVLTPFSLAFNKNISTYNDETTFLSTAKYSMPNLGMIFAFNRENKGKWSYFQFGFGYNRIADFSRYKFIVDGNSAGSSIGIPFSQLANGHIPENMMEEASAAWDSYLIDVVSPENLQYEYLHTNVNLQQQMRVRTKGAIDEMTLTGGGNWNDKLYLGATLGIPILNYDEKRNYYEVDANNEIPIFTSFLLNDHIRQSAVGINLKLGILYQPVDFLRLGVAFHTPTYYGQINYNFDREIIAVSDTFSPNLSFSNYNYYKLTTPLKAMFNMAFIIQKRAFISVEYEFADYGTASLAPNEKDPSYYLYKTENQLIPENYGISHIVRLGSEVNLTQKFQIRAGYNFQTSPIRQASIDDALHTASFGIGFRGKIFSLDLAYLYSISKEKYWFYNPEYVNATEQTFSSNRFVVSLGFRF